MRGVWAVFPDTLRLQFHFILCRGLDDAHIDDELKLPRDWQEEAAGTAAGPSAPSGMFGHICVFSGVQQWDTICVCVCVCAGGLYVKPAVWRFV